MSDEEPVRLKDQGSASPELVRALRALGTSSDAARLERVAQKLGAALAEGQPPMAASSGGLLGVKALIAGLAAAGIAALAWYGSSARAPAPERRTPATELQAPPAPPPSAAGEPSAPAAPPEAPSPAPSAPAKLSSRHAPSRARLSAPASTPASVGPASAAPAANPNATPAAPARAPQPEPASKPASPQPPAAEPTAPPPSEAALLFGARKAVASQPSAALRLLDQHAARFPDGLLTPEREVLRIEALRRLGRTAEADQRLRAFQARYPDSIHLRRLQQSEAGEH